MWHKTELTQDLHLNGLERKCCSQRWISQLPRFPVYMNANKTIILYWVSLALHMGTTHFAPHFPKSNPDMQNFFSKGIFYHLECRNRWTGEARKQSRSHILALTRQGCCGNEQVPKLSLVPWLSPHFLRQQQIQGSIVESLKHSHDYIHLHTFHCLDRTLGKDKTIAGATLQTQQI